MHNNSNYEIAKMKKLFESELDRWKDKAEKRKIKNKEMKAMLQQAEKQIEEGNTTNEKLADALEDSHTQM